VIPVIPGCPTYLGLTCYSSLHDIPGELDIVQVYLHPGIDLLSIAKEIIAKHAKGLWVEEAGAIHDVKKLLAEAKIYVVEYENLEREFNKHLQPSLVKSTIVPPERNITVAERMVRHPTTIKRTDNLGVALQKMKEGHFRHLPVVNQEGRLLGMLSDRDIRLIHPSLALVPYEVAEKQFRATTVEQAAVFNPVTILSDAPLERAAELMLQWEIGALPVVAQGDYLVGIITHSDLLKEFAARGKQKAADFKSVARTED
jgi:CBS domain-containing protein